MTWTPPVPVLRVALSLGPYDEPLEADWTDLSDRVKEWSVKRGRSGDILDVFRPGQLTVELDNEDLMLDTSNASGLVYLAAGDGLPRCQVTFDLDIGGTEYRQFTGFLGPDCWPASEGRGIPSVTLHAVDDLDRSPSLATDTVDNMWAAMHPDWWVRMYHGFPVVVDGSELDNWSGDGSYANVDGMGVGILGSVQSRQVTLRDDGYIISYAVDVMPDGDELNMTVAVGFKSPALGTGESAVVAQMIEAGGGNRRWQVVVDDAGDAQITSFDATETLVDTATLSNPGGRWDDGQAHLLLVRFTSGNTMDVWLDGYDTTLTATSTVYESDLYVGPSDINLMALPFLLWRRALTDDEIAGVVLAFGQTTFGPWHGDSYADRIGHWYDAAGKPIDFDDTSRWHVPAPDPDDAFNGVTSPPDTLAEALRETVGPLGAVWVDRDGYYVVRTVHALTDATYEDEYQTPIAVFTDEDTTLSAGEYRHAGITKRGPTLDTVINEAYIGFTFISNPSPLTLNGSSIIVRDDPSILRYGRCRQNYQSDRYGWASVASTADQIIARYAQPRDDLDTIDLDCRTDNDLTLWVADECELERNVTVAYTPRGGSLVTVTDQNIQGIDIRGDSSSLWCVLTLARS